MPDRLDDGLNYSGEPAVYPDGAPVNGWTDGQDAIGVLLRDRMRELDHRTLERLDHGVDLSAEGGWTLYDSQRLSILLWEGLDTAVEDHPSLDRDAAGSCAAWAYLYESVWQDGKPGPVTSAISASSAPTARAPCGPEPWLSALTARTWRLRRSALGCSARWPLPALCRPGWVAGLRPLTVGSWVAGLLTVQTLNWAAGLLAFSRSWVAGLRLPVQRGLKLSWVAGRVIGPPPSWVAGLRAVPDSWVAGWTTVRQGWVAGLAMALTQSWAAGLPHRYRLRPGPIGSPTGPGVCFPGRRWPRATRSRSDPDASAIAGQFRERGVKPAFVLSSSSSLITIHLPCRFTALREYSATGGMEENDRLTPGKIATQHKETKPFAIQRGTAA